MGDGARSADARTAPAAAVHHVVGGDPGWAVASDVLAWSAGRLFTVGDTLWFAYEAAEVAGEAEFEPCEAGDPIRTYTDGLSRVRVGLDDEGTRYFLSADPAKCKGGLKLRVDVRATVSVSPRSVDRAAAAAPAPPAPPASSGTQAVVPLVRRALCLVSVWCFLFLGA
ncbi:hypothetical protein VPH35_117926 [Triticum aestivum]